VPLRDSVIFISKCNQPPLSGRVRTIVRSATCAKLSETTRNVIPFPKRAPIQPLGPSLQSMRRLDIAVFAVAVALAIEFVAIAVSITWDLV
jgi:hypothetical protein